MSGLAQSRTRFRAQLLCDVANDPWKLRASLRDHGRSACFDVRDKIYGLLGLFNARAIVPSEVDYSISVEQLLLVTLTYILEKKHEPTVAVCKLLQEVLCVDSRAMAFQTWFRSSLSFPTGGTHFLWDLESHGLSELPISVEDAFLIGTITFESMLLLGTATEQRVLSRLESSSKLNEEPLDWVHFAASLTTYRETLCSAVQNVTTSSSFAIKKDVQSAASLTSSSQRVGRVLSPTVAAHFARAYLDDHPQDTAQQPKICSVTSGGVALVCPAAQQGDTVCVLARRISNASLAACCDLESPVTR